MAIICNDDGDDNNDDDDGNDNVDKMIMMAMSVNRRRQIFDRCIRTHTYICIL